MTKCQFIWRVICRTTNLKSHTYCAFTTKQIKVYLVLVYRNIYSAYVSQKRNVAICRNMSHCALPKPNIAISHILLESVRYCDIKGCDFSNIKSATV